MFAAGYAPGPFSVEQLAPFALPFTPARAELERLLGSGIAWIGSGTRLIGLEPSFESGETREPSALGVGLLATELDPAGHPAVPVYVRDAGATLPNLGAPTPH